MPSTAPIIFSFNIGSGKIPDPDMFQYFISSSLNLLHSIMEINFHCEGKTEETECSNLLPVLSINYDR